MTNLRPTLGDRAQVDLMQRPRIGLRSGNHFLDAAHLRYPRPPVGFAPIRRRRVGTAPPYVADGSGWREMMVAKRMAMSVALSAVLAVEALTVLSVASGDSSFLPVIAVLVVLVSVPASLITAAITENMRKVNAGLPAPVGPALGAAAASALAIPLAQHLSLTPPVIVGAAVALIAGCSSWWTWRRGDRGERHAKSS